MAKDGILHRLEDDPRDRTCAFDVFDRAAFEGRLREARARRAIVLANKLVPMSDPPEGLVSPSRLTGVGSGEVLIDIESALEKDDETSIRESLPPREPEPLVGRLVNAVSSALPARGSLTLLLGMFVAGLGLGSWGTLVVATRNEQAPFLQTDAAPVTGPMLVADREPSVPSTPVMIETPTPHVSPRPVLTPAALPVPAPTVVPVTAPEPKPAPKPAEPVVAEETPLARSLVGRPYPRPAPGLGNGTDPTKGALELRRESVPPAATETASAEQILDVLRGQGPEN